MHRGFGPKRCLLSPPSRSRAKPLWHREQALCATYIHHSCSSSWNSACGGDDCCSVLAVAFVSCPTSRARADSVVRGRVGLRDMQLLALVLLLLLRLLLPLPRRAWLPCPLLLLLLPRVFASPVLLLRLLPRAAVQFCAMLSRSFSPFSPMSAARCELCRRRRLVMVALVGM